MFFKASPTSQEPNKNEQQKDSKTPPKRSFKEFMATRNLPSFSHRRNTVYDLAAKNQHNSHSKHKKKESDNAPHGAQQGHMEAQQNQLETLSSIIRVKGLSMEMNALIDKMADFIQTESQNGISTTTVSIDMKEGMSLFHGSELRIDHYDTAPHSFNIQLSGNPEAIDAFQQHLASLQTALQQRLEHFHIALLNPVLTEKLQDFDPYKKEKRKPLYIQKVRNK